MSEKKPVTQAGVKNFLGKQEMVKAPKFWLSEPGHVKAKLAYITNEEEQILIDKNLYGSLKGKANRGPAGLPSLQGGDFGAGGGNSGNNGSGNGGKTSARDDYMGSKGKTKGGVDGPYDGGSGGVQTNVTTTSKLGKKDPNQQYIDFGKRTKTIEVATPHTKTGTFTTEVKVGPSARQRQDVNEFRKQAQYAISPMSDPKNKAMAIGLSLLMPGLGTMFSQYKTNTALGYSASNAFNNITGKATDFLSKFTQGTAPTNPDTKDGEGGISSTVREQVINNILNVQKAAGVPKSQLITNYWYSSLGNTSPSGFTFSFQKQLNEAKAKQNIILNNSSSVGQLAVNQSPFFDFLKTSSLNKGIL